jgi:hypothetical protein
LSIYDKEIMKIPRILVVPIMVAMVVAFSFLVGLVAHWFGAYNPQMWGAFSLFGIMGGFILYICFRQIYWWFTGKVDYQDGGFPKLWRKIFKK